MRSPNSLFDSRTLLALAALVLLPACGEVEIPVNLNLDPAGPNRLELLEPDGSVRTSLLTGGAEATLILDTDRLLSREGVVATIQVNDIRIAGDSFRIRGIVPTETLCLEPDPAQPSGGFAFLRPFVKEEADIQLTLATLAHATNPNLQDVAPPLPFTGEIDTTVPLDLGDLLDLAAGETGALTVTETIRDTIPEDVDLVGGFEVTVTVTLTNGDAPPQGPLLDECDAFFAEM